MFLFVNNKKQSLPSIAARWSLLRFLVFIISFILLPGCVWSFTTQRLSVATISSSPLVSHQPHSSRAEVRINQQLTRRFNFFKNLIDQAFDNDASLSKSNKRDGMLVGPDDTDNDEDFFVSSSVKQLKQQRVDALTDTQIEWRKRQQALNQVTYDDIADKTFVFDLYLTGVPNKDPSNDLYGSRTNVSSRDRSIGLTVPKDPTVSSVSIAFLSGNKCQVVSDDKTGFTICQSDGGNNISSDDTINQYDIGDWKLSDDGSQIRFRFGVRGYQRTIETKGTIQKVFWSKLDETTTQTSTIYSIPSGWLYGDCKISKKSTTAVNMNRIEWDEDSAILRIEQTTGLLGVSTKMIPCGKFTVQTIS
jgi:hypothetical protein